MSWIKQILIALDQLANAILLGYADETLSARCWRNRNKSFYWATLRWSIDVIALCFLDFNHCEKSYNSEIQRNQLPREYRWRS
jgi:hypothetical protein